MPSSLTWAKFKSFVGMLVVGFEKKIIFLLRKIEARKGNGVNASGVKREPNYHPVSKGRFEIWTLWLIAKVLLR